jgi:Fe-S-cluster containining protein
MWYREGLKFSCTGCGGCCTGDPGFVWVNKNEIETLAAALKLDVDPFKQRYVRMVGIRRSLIEHSNGDCIFFDNKSRKCRVYDARPRQCRTWPFWPSNLASLEAWNEIAERCPGCNRGKTTLIETIQSQLKIVSV